MKKILRSFWGCIPATFVLLCIIIIVTVNLISGDTLRIVPLTVLIIVGVISFGLLLLWANIKYMKHSQNVDTNTSRMLGTIIKFLSLIVFSVSVVICFFFLIFGYTPEHIVIKNDIKMIAKVRSFLEEQVDYYQYKNVLFCGKWLGHENYGNGGGDPLAEEETPEPKSWIFYDLDGNVIDKGTKSDPSGYYGDFEQQAKEEALLEQEEKGALLNKKAEIRQFDINVLQNRENELVFSISINDYIDGYNGFHWRDYKTRYLLPTDKWRTQILDTAIHSEHETIYYNFTEDEKVWPLPTISVYVPTNEEYIQEVTVNFDWHSYTENMYTLYEEMCLYTLKIFFPDLSDERIIELYKEVNAVGYENVFSSDKWYSKDSVPYALYYRGNIAIYPYFAIGSWQNLCIIPVTEDTIKEFEQKGVIINEIK